MGFDLTTLGATVVASASSPSFPLAVTSGLVILFFVLAWISGTKRALAWLVSLYPAGLTLYLLPAHGALGAIRTLIFETSTKSGVIVFTILSLVFAFVIGRALGHEVWEGVPTRVIRNFGVAVGMAVLYLGLVSFLFPLEHLEGTLGAIDRLFSVPLLQFASMAMPPFAMLLAPHPRI